MQHTDELYQEMIEKQIEQEAKEQGLTVEDLLIMKAEEEAEAKYYDEMAEAEELKEQFYRFGFIS